MINNVIIIDLKKLNEITNILVNENFVKGINNERNNAEHQTGTMKFMKIQMLQRVLCIYRHNFKSLFYVFL